MHRKRRKLLCIVSLLLVFAALSATTGGARTGPPPAIVPAPGIVTQQAISAGMVEPLADGSKNPASIPDEIALRALFLTPSSVIAGLSESARLRAKLGRMQLDASDLAVVTQALGQLQPQASAQRARITAALEAGRSGGTTPTFATIASLDGQLDMMVADTYRQLLLSLSPAGAVKLRDHVAYTKTKIKIIPPPKMTKAHH